MPRIDPLPPEDWDADLQRILGRELPGGSRLGDNHIFSTFARHKDLLRAWLPFGGFLLGGGVLGARERELLILRTGANCGSDYEWGQHVRISEALGMSREEIERVAAGPDAEGWSAADAALLRAADELHTDRTLSDDVWASLRGELRDVELIEVCLLVGHYEMLAMTINSLGVQPEAA